MLHAAKPIDRSNETEHACSARAEKTQMPKIPARLRGRGLDALTFLVLAMAGYLMSAPLRQKWAQHRSETASLAAVKRKWEDLRSASSSLAGDPAAVQVLEISDYECPFCRKASASVDSAVRSGLRVGYLHYPLAAHPHAEGAAIAALCAESSEKFREMHALLMSSTDWEKDSNWAREAKAAGVADLHSFEECVRGRAVRVRLARERALADSLGMRGTPTFVSREGFHRGIATTAELFALDRRE
jgi:2-hydroxychromene-2-carboxylate isomerase